MNQRTSATNLTRDPRNGRDYEYLSDDPWHFAAVPVLTCAAALKPRLF